MATALFLTILFIMFAAALVSGHKLLERGSNIDVANGVTLLAMAVVLGTPVLDRAVSAL